MGNNKINSLSPIVLFTYNRPWHTRQTVEALLKNELAEDSELFVFSDGPKREEDITKVKEVREYIKTTKGLKRVEIIEREKNIGLATNMIDGVTRVVNEYGKIIVLEDDLVTSPYFLRFINEALEYYEDKEKVMHINGFIFNMDTQGLPDTFFTRRTHGIGWATWARAWKYFKKNPEKLVKEFTKQQIKELNFNGAYDYWSQVIANLEGCPYTWGIFWLISVYKVGGLCFTPRMSYVVHIGDDENASHVRKKTNIYRPPLADILLKFTEKIDVCYEAEQRLAEFFKSIRSPLWRRIAGKIKRMVLG